MSAGAVRMSTAEEAAFVSHLTAHPGDRTARLAYADWLEEHGRSLAAAWMREDGTPPLVPRIEGDGAGKGDGEGDGHTNGQGDSGGYGDGSGYAYASGEGDCGGHGYGRGGSECYADGEGGGNGFSYSHGEGRGSCDINTPSLFKLLIPQQEVHMPAPGEYVIVRSRDQGCVCGEYRSHHGREVVLSKARQIYSWEGQRRAQVDFAVVPRPCQLSREAPGEMVMLEACGITPTTRDVEAFLRAHPGE